MPSQPCKELCIPDYLHKDDREVNNNFDADEVFYRRFNVKKEYLKVAGRISNCVFSLNDDSYNRSKYSNYPSDVLYSITKPNCEAKVFQKSGIYKINVLKFNNQTIQINVDKNLRDITFKAEHTPSECIYPHSEMLIFEGDNKLSEADFKGTSLKHAIRTHLLSLEDLAGIVKEPEYDVIENSNKE